ncbi:MAG TPA: DUF2911 domain-containing protein [Gemmatimonadaceae bacterium]|nr:DUF2911 domain-containing protein [Gemmatimonadaceae bacterium]
MSVKKILAGLMFVGSAVLPAQTPVTGTFVSTLGVDTAAVERYSRTRNKLEGDILLRYPRVRIVHYVADLEARRFRGMSLVTRRVGADPASPPTFSMVALMSDTAATVEIQRGGKPDTVNTGRRTYHSGRIAPAVPSEPPSFAVYEQMLAFNPPTAADSVIITTISGSAGPNSTISMTRHGKDSVFFNSSFFPGWIERASVDASGRITGVDATATTVKTMTRRVSDLDFDALARAWASVEAAKGAAGQMSPPDTIRSTIGTATVEVAYSRPLRRGRVIFGNVVPWNQVWRTGANAATQFTTSADLMFGTTLVPAGKYTLWSLPIPTGAKLIINSQTGQWGTDYDASKDFARLELTQTILTKPVDAFTFSIVPQGSNVFLKFAWDDREYSIPFRLK